MESLSRWLFLFGDNEEHFKSFEQCLQYSSFSTSISMHQGDLVFVQILKRYIWRDWMNEKIIYMTGFC